MITLLEKLFDTEFKRILVDKDLTFADAIILIDIFTSQLEVDLKDDEVIDLVIKHYINVNNVLKVISVFSEWELESSELGLFNNDKVSLLYKKPEQISTLQKKRLGLYGKVAPHLIEIDKELRN